ncbi:MAG: hypothetical protein AAGF24_05640, partial [Cyanobacteria bacterium P01_H01_bin.121]
VKSDQPDQRLQTRISIVDGEINNDIGATFLESQAQHELLNLHAQQTQISMRQNVEALQAMLSLWAQVTAPKPPDSRTKVSRPLSWLNKDAAPQDTAPTAETGAGRPERPGVRGLATAAAAGVVGTAAAMAATTPDEPEADELLQNPDLVTTPEQASVQSAVAVPNREPDAIAAAIAEDATVLEIPAPKITTTPEADALDAPLPDPFATSTVDTATPAIPIDTGLDSESLELSDADSALLASEPPVELELPDLEVANVAPEAASIDTDELLLATTALDPSSADALEIPDDIPDPLAGLELNADVFSEVAAPESGEDIATGQSTEPVLESSLDTDISDTGIAALDSMAADLADPNEPENPKLAPGTADELEPPLVASDLRGAADLITTIEVAPSGEAALDSPTFETQPPVVAEAAAIMEPPADPATADPVTADPFADLSFENATTNTPDLDLGIPLPDLDTPDEGVAEVNRAEANAPAVADESNPSAIDPSVIDPSLLEAAMPPSDPTIPDFAEFDAVNSAAAVPDTTITEKFPEDLFGDTGAGLESDLDILTLDDDELDTQEPNSELNVATPSPTAAQDVDSGTDLEAAPDSDLWGGLDLDADASVDGVSLEGDSETHESQAEPASTDSLEAAIPAFDLSDDDDISEFLNLADDSPAGSEPPAEFDTELDDLIDSAEVEESEVLEGLPDANLSSEFQNLLDAETTGPLADLFDNATAEDFMDPSEQLAEANDLDSFADLEMLDADPFADLDLDEFENEELPPPPPPPSR